MNPEQWLSLKWNGGSTMSDRWLNQSKIIHKGQTTEKVLRSYTYDVYGKVKEIKDYRNRYAKKNGRSGKV